MVVVCAYMHPNSDIDLPTFLAGPGMLSNNLYLVLLSSSVFHLASFRFGDDSYGFDHLPVLCSLDTTHQGFRSASRRYNIKNLDYPGFRARYDELSRDLLPRLELEVDHRLIYEGFLLGVSFALEACGAYRPSSLRGKRKDQPLWWNSQCDAALAKRRSAIKEYLRDQTRQGKAALYWEAFRTHGLEPER